MQKAKNSTIQAGNVPHSAKGGRVDVSQRTSKPRPVTSETDTK